MSENGEIYTAGKTFTLPPAVMALTNLTSAPPLPLPPPAGQAMAKYKGLFSEQVLPKSTYIFFFLTPI